MSSSDRRDTLRQIIVDSIHTILRRPDDDIESKRNLLEYGRQSLDAVPLKAELVQALGLSTPDAIVFQHPAVDALAEYLDQRVDDNKPTHRVPDLRPMPVGQPQQLSFAQHESWLHHYHNPTVSFANIPVGFCLHGDLNPPTLCAGLEAIAQRDAILRTGYIVQQDQLLQVREPRSGLVLAHLEWSSTSPPQQESALAQWLQREVRGKPFELSQLPLWRAYLVRIDSRTHHLHLAVHHIQFDFAATRILESALTQLYHSIETGAASQRPALPLQYADYAALQRRLFTPDELRIREDYWDSLIANVPPCLELALRPARGLSARSDVLIREMDGQETLKLTNFSRQNNVTIYGSLLAALAALRSPYSDGFGVIIEALLGSKINHPWLKGLIGHFAGRGSLRLDFNGHNAVADFLPYVQSVINDAPVKQDITFSQLQQMLHPEAPYTTHQPYQVVLNMLSSQDPGAPEWTGSPLMIQPLNSMSFPSAIPKFTRTVKRQGEGADHLRFE